MKPLRFAVFISVALGELAALTYAKKNPGLMRVDRYPRLFHVPRGGSLSLHDLKEHKPCNSEILQKLKASRGGAKKQSNALEPAPKNSALSKFFPIFRSELPQFMFMSVMMFLFIYVYTTARDTKDTLIVSKCGAEAVPFLKMYGVMPSAFLFILGYSKMAQTFGKQTLFYATILPFFAFFGIFAFLLFPNREKIHFSDDSLSSWLQHSGPAGKAAGNLVRYWSFSLFYIISELWASAGVPLLFWQVANDITSVSQAKRFYPLFAVTGNLAPIVSGKVMSYFISTQKTSDDVGFSSTLKKLAFLKIVSGAIIILLYKLVYIESDRAALDNIKSGETQVVEAKPKTDRGKGRLSKMEDKGIATSTKPTLKESIIGMSKSKELKSMATIVLCYNICIELTEVLWKGILRKTYPNTSDYMNFMASFSQKVGTFALLLQLLASTIIGRLGWTNASRVTPLAMLVLSVPFFVVVAISTRNPTMIPLMTALTIGTWQNVISKVTKYSLFDPLKEMAYIPMGPDAKTKGKAAIDVMGAKLGRCVAAGSQQALVLGTGSILNSAPYLGVCYLGTISLWLSALNVLGKMFDQQEEQAATKERSMKASKF
mmetsp:Transcript_1261/g.1932  ORF Transcript_1261/g.1932 Transcript_1261/m.1932 type:complete len:600 (+) Transcript_1261:3-1802(+)